MNRKQKLIIILIALSLLNIFLSGFIENQTKLETQSETCFIQEQDCYEVQESEFSTFLGISLPSYGIATFSILTIFLTMLLIISIKKEETRLYKYENKTKQTLKLMMIVGLLSSIYLIYLQKFTIGSFCNYCLIIDSTMIFIAAAYLFILH